MIVYIDSSVVLRILLRQSNPIKNWGGWQRAYASELLRVEIYRTIDRLRLMGALNDSQRATLSQEIEQFYRNVYRVALSESILERAAQPLAVPLGTLDALHLATALAIAEHEDKIIFLTHDTQLSLAAQSMNFEVQGVKTQS